MSTPAKWIDHEAEALKIGGKVVWVPEEWGDSEWASVEHLPEERFYVDCSVTKDFEWFAFLVWNLGKWDYPVGRKKRKDGHFFMKNRKSGETQLFPFKDITHYHCYGLKGEKVAKKVILVPREKLL